MKIFKPWFIALSVIVCVAFNQGEARILNDVSKRTGGQDLNAKFNQMCEPHFKSLRKMRQGDPTRSMQFAVLWIGDKNYPQKVLDPNNVVVSEESGGKFYVAARLDKEADQDRRPVSEHAEQVVLRKAEEMIKAYSKLNGAADLYLYTRNKPCCYRKDDGQIESDADKDCPGCSNFISEWVNGAKGKDVKSLTLTWDYQLAYNNDRKYLFGLAKLVEPPPGTASSKLKIHYNAKSKCRSTSYGWFQKSVYTCIINKMSEQTKANKMDYSFCMEEEKFKPDLVKLINRVTWMCGTRTKAEATIPPTAAPKKVPRKDPKEQAKEEREKKEKPGVGRDQKCLEDKMKLEGKMGAKKDGWKGPFLKIVTDCVAEKHGESLGLALSPNEPNTFTYLFTEIKGNYPNDQKYCFYP